MGVLAGPTGQVLAELSTVLTAGSAGVDVVARRAARAAAELVGDVGAVRLSGGHEPEPTVFVHHRDATVVHRISDLLTEAGDEPAELVRTSGRPVVVVLGDVSAVLVCPLLAEQQPCGYLALARIEPDGAYTEADIEVAAEVAARVGTAVAAARSAERLHAIEEQYRSIVETTLEGVWQLDADGVTTFANERLATIVGLSPEQLTGRHVADFLGPQGAADLARRLAAHRDGRPEVYETRLVRADRTARWVQISAAPLCGEARGPAASLLMVTDRSEHVHAREMKRQLDHLRRLDSLGQLVGGIAHDFRNLFTVIAGSAEVIAGATHHELADQIVDATLRGRALTHQLLAFGRGGGPPESISIPDLLDDVQELLSRTIGEHIRLDINVSDGLWPVRAERGPLEQVLVNLAVNARDAMSRGGTLIVEAANTVVEAGQLTDPAMEGRFVQLAVSDTGTGMSPETRERAFEPFFGTKPTAAGLGLTTVESVLRDVGGHVELRSERGIGTTVKLYLRPGDPPDPDANRATPAQSTRHGNVLVVEDQPELAELIRYLLAPAGYTVRVVTTVGEAIAHVNAGVDPDLLLTDVVMPGMTGPQLAAALRARKPDLRVLYMSGYTAGDLTRQGDLDPGSPLIHKPFTRDTLLAAVELALLTPPAAPAPPAAG